MLPDLLLLEEYKGEHFMFRISIKRDDLSMLFEADGSSLVAKEKKQPSKLSSMETSSSSSRLNVPVYNSKRFFFLPVVSNLRRRRHHLHTTCQAPIKIQ